MTPSSGTVSKGGTISYVISLGSKSQDSNNTGNNGDNSGNSGNNGRIPVMEITVVISKKICREKL